MMTEEQSAAFINSQTALLNAEIEAMKAENQFCTDNGNSVAYGDEQFSEVIKRYEGYLRSDSVLWILTHGELPPVMPGGER